MADVDATGFSAVAGNNTTIDDGNGTPLGIQGTNAVSNFDGGLRSLMAAVAIILGKLQSGTSRPANVRSGSLWLDTSGGVTAHIVKYYDGTDDISVFTINTTANTMTFNGTLSGDVTGNVTGNLTGDVTGNLIGEIRDANGNEILVPGATASAVNHVQVTNRGTGSPPIIEAVGDDTNVGLVVQSKGTGAIQILVNGAEVLEATTAGIDVTGTISVGGTALTSVTKGNTTAATLPANDTETTPVSTGLGSKPDQVWVKLICTTADAGWAVGDEFNFSTSVTDGNKGLAIVASSTDSVSIKTGFSGVGVPNQTGGTATLTPASWNYEIHWVKYGS